MIIEFFVKIAFVIMFPFAILYIGFDIGKSHIEFIMKGRFDNE